MQQLGHTQKHETGMEYNTLLMLSIEKPYTLKQILSGKLTEAEEKE